ncbi:DUF1775 domain-containing protein [Paracoccus limosus]|uniref:DUF1775 domain-containing protein n=1 Tax=Paracoccus limosus TaxID=913252 RepID=A0A844H8C7_9RHOB|nr:copper chaperone PCu(A)C [Paracoccus limosus]MTH34648.1 DUF1775 domain-containing protein [Paracoccus limosus]
MKPMILAAAMASLFAGPALAHVALDQPEAPAGAGYKAVLRIGHGCEGKATTALRVKLPDGFYDAKPMPKPGWTLKTVTGDYARPFDKHGDVMTSGTREIIWSGGELPDAWYDEFTLRGTIGPEVAPGTVLYFPTVQECGKTRAGWIDVTGAEGVEHPAPALTVTAPVAAQAGHGGHDAGGHAAHDAGGDQAAAPAADQAGDIRVDGAFARATPPGADLAGGFLTIHNRGAADRLVEVSTALADHVEIHEMVMQGDVMTMRPQPDGLPIPAGQTVELKPGGYHLMLMGLKQPLAQGETVPLTLTFEKAGKLDATLQVGPVNARAAGGDHAGH